MGAVTWSQSSPLNVPLLGEDPEAQGLITSQGSTLASDGAWQSDQSGRSWPGCHPTSQGTGPTGRREMAGCVLTVLLCPVNWGDATSRDCSVALPAGKPLDKETSACFLLTRRHARLYGSFLLSFSLFSLSLPLPSFQLCLDFLAHRLFLPSFCCWH